MISDHLHQTKEGLFVTGEVYIDKWPPPKPRRVSMLTDLSNLFSGKKTHAIAILGMVFVIKGWISAGVMPDTATMFEELKLYLALMAGRSAVAKNGGGK